MKLVRIDPSATSLSMDKNPVIFFDDDYQVLEAPVLWVSDVAKRRSGSKKTADRYSGILARYLQWLDDSGYGSHAWASIDKDIFGQYVAHLQSVIGPTGDVPSRESVLDYVSRVIDFYVWARREKYKHFLEIEMRDVEVFARKNQLLLAHVSNSTIRKIPKIEVRPGPAKKVESEVNKLVSQNEYEVALSLMDDLVYVFMAVIVRVTAVRPKELLQLPYRGKDKNSAFIPYDADCIPGDLAEEDLYFYCESKGKNRCIKFPGALWVAICQKYLPLRRQRALLYRKREGVSPPNTALFLTERGYIVDYSTLYRAFDKVAETAKAYRLAGREVGYTKAKFGARMLRHTCATYFVIDAMRRRNRLGKAYIYDVTIDNDLRDLLGHEDVETTYKYYVHLINKMFADDLLVELHRKRVDEGLSTMLDRLGFQH